MPPKDLNSFWKRTTEELARTKASTALEEAPEQSGREYLTSQVTLDSFQGRRLRAWYSVPKVSSGPEGPRSWPLSGWLRG